LKSTEGLGLTEFGIEMSEDGDWKEQQQLDWEL
jgi:hypothetical protein